MPETNPPRARKGYDEELVFPRGFTVAVVEHLGDLVLRVELHDSARVERMPLTPHEARQIASLLRNGTELDHIPHRSCDEALEAARKERDDATDEFARMLRERDEWKRRAEYAERELSSALGLPTAIGPAEGEAKRIVDERDAAIAERDDLLAIIHRDGGHYVGEHGITKAVADAHATWAAVVAERDRLRRELEALRNAAEPVADALRDIAGDAHTAYLDRLDAILRGES